jgi:hypothetical protein
LCKPGGFSREKVKIVTGLHPVGETTKLGSRFRLDHNLSAPERKEIAAAIGRIANAVAAEMPADSAGVTSVKISFGNRNEYLSLK